MEQQPHQPNGGEKHPKVNSYGTDDPEEQAKIEQARAEAAEQRRGDREEWERYVAAGINEEDAEGLVEFQRHLREQREQTAKHDRARPETEPAPRAQPRIYVADLASAAHGLEHGSWIDANQPADELDADIAAILDNSPTVGADRWAVEATEDFAGLDLHGFTDTTLISRLARGVAEHGAAYAVYVQIVGSDDRDLLDRFEDFYVGSYDSPEAWAREVGKDLEWGAHLDQVVDPMLRPYVVIDYARFAHDQRQNWDVLEGHDGKTHVFMR